MLCACIPVVTFLLVRYLDAVDSPRAVRRTVDPRLRLLPGGLGDPAAALRERRQAAPRHR